MEIISFDEFKKIDFRVGFIKSAENLEGSEKLVKLEVDLGELGTRQILAGIRLQYTPESLVGKQIIVVANLAPRKLMGEVSEGMLLAASGEGPVLLVPESDVPSGSLVR